MKKLAIKKFFILFVVLGFSKLCLAQNPFNLTEKQIFKPAELANAITTKKEVPLIISVGPGTTIPNSVNVGMVNTKEGLDKLKTQLTNISKHKKIVVYCGCCPYEHCPNVRPAINALKELKFTNYYLLDLPQNIKKDWIDKGYPVSKS
ncbi:MAG: hypothetical protein JWQ96_601 [Segetibacter sp.]|nr:hypothetical protein [Segetibacter sp.]